MKIFFIFIILLVTIAADAQYYENNVINDVFSYIVNQEVTKSIRIKDAQLLAANKVKEVLIRNEEQKPIGKLSINNFGFIEDFYNYNDTSGIIEYHWRYGYDVNNNMTSASFRQGRQRINYILTYENNQLASVHKDSAGVESQYDFACVEGKIFKITLLNLVRDTVEAIYFFNYDSDGRLSTITNESRGVVFTEITYSNTAVHFSNNYTTDVSYKFKDERIKYYTSTYIFDNPASAVVRRDQIRNEYAYTSNGLIESLEIKSLNGKPIYTEYYEYAFY